MQSILIALSLFVCAVVVFSAPGSPYPKHDFKMSGNHKRLEEDHNSADQSFSGGHRKRYNGTFAPFLGNHRHPENNTWPHERADHKERGSRDITPVVNWTRESPFVTD